MIAKQSFARFLQKEEEVLMSWDRHFWHHFILTMIIILGLCVFYLVSYSKLKQFATGVTMACLYVVWGITHHKLDGNLHLKNVIEYLFIAILSIVILGGILL